MILWLDGREINQLTLGLIDESSEGSTQWLAAPQTFAADVGDFLVTVERFLESNAVKHEALTGLALKAGVGSSTALRAVYALAHAWSWAGDIPLYAVDATDETGSVSLGAPREFVHLEYGKDPTITSPKKDALRRHLTV